jgi:hypothetical protein
MGCGELEFKIDVFDTSILLLETGLMDLDVKSTSKSEDLEEIALSL